MRRSLPVFIVAALALGAALYVAGPASAAATTATFTKVSDWGSGWEGRYTISNGGSTAIDGSAAGRDGVGGVSNALPTTSVRIRPPLACWSE